MEDGARAARLDALEHRYVDGTGDIVEGDEDDPLARANRRGLARNLHPRHPHFRIVAAPCQPRCGGAPELGQQRTVEIHDVTPGVDAGDLELGLRLLER